MAHGTERRNSRRRHGGKIIPKLSPAEVLKDLGGRRDPVITQTLGRAGQREGDA